MSIPLSRKALALTSASALAVATLAIGASSAIADEADSSSELSTVLGVDNPDKIHGEYIVQLNSELSTMNMESVADDFDAAIFSEFELFNGFAAQMSHADAEALAAHSDVNFVEQNSAVDVAAGPGEQEDPPSWGLDRIDQRSGPLDGLYTYPNTALTISAYVMDTGINTSHVDFEGRIGNGYDAIDDGDIEDCQGHGTAVSGVIGGTEHGVAKDVTIHPVRVLDCDGSGSMDGVIGGIEWIVDDADGVAIANASLGAPADASLDAAVNAAVDAGIFFVAAAGSSADDACNYSPAGAEAAFVFGSTDMSDSIGSGSNVGPCVDMFAPGVDITVPWIDGDDSTSTMSGSSLGAAHGAGAAAMVLRDNPDFSPAEIGTWLTENATSIDGPEGPVGLLYVWED